MDFVTEIENSTGQIAKKKFMPMQDGDVEKTWADVSHLTNSLNYQPKVSVKEGIKNFVDWYKEFYHYNEVEAVLRQHNMLPTENVVIPLAG
jgi:UDP-glucuronate 4-epimerase